MSLFLVCDQRAEYGFEFATVIDTIHADNNAEAIEKFREEYEATEYVLYTQRGRVLTTRETEYE